MKNELRMLGSDAVTVRDPFIHHSFQLETAYLLSLEPQRLLAGFRETAGFPANAHRYGGWERTEIQGHTLGHYLTAMAQAWAVSRNPEIQQRIRETIDALRECQRTDGYLFASAEELFHRVERKEPVWVPWYTMHKIVAGLVSVCTLTGYPEAEIVLRNLADWITNRVLSWSETTRQTVLTVEYGGMNDCLYDVYALTGEPRYLEAAHRFDELPLFQALAEGKDVLNGLHANTTIPKVLGGLKRYAVTGGREPIYLRMAENFWDMVVYHHTYLSGGNSEWEHFGKPDILDAERTACNCETCNTYNMIKLSQLLFSLTGKKKYADYDAWAYVNTILSSQNHETGMTTYFQPMDTGFFKVYSRPYDQFWCCTGTGMENFTKPWTGIAYESAGVLYLNRLVSADIRTGDVSISLDADWMQRDTLIIQIHTCPAGWTIALRHPHWAADCQLQLPEKIHCRKAEDGFLYLFGEWKGGMVLSIRFCMEVMRHGLPDNAQTAAYSYGPFMLSADLGTEDLRTDVTGVDVTVPTRDIPVRDYLLAPVILPGDRQTSFRLRSCDGMELQLSPHFLKNQVRYGIYFRIFQPDSPELKAYLSELRRKEYAMRQFDAIPLGNDQYELAHGIQGAKTDSFADAAGRGREILPGGFVSYWIQIPETPCNLHLIWQGCAEITLDGTALVASPVMPVPAHLLGRKAQIRIRNRMPVQSIRLFDELYIARDQNE